MLTIRCSCGKQLKAQDSARGKQVKCPGCAKLLRIPQATKAVTPQQSQPAKLAPEKKAKPAPAKPEAFDLPEFFAAGPAANGFDLNDGFASAPAASGFDQSSPFAAFPAVTAVPTNFGNAPFAATTPAAKVSVESPKETAVPSEDRKRMLLLAIAIPVGGIVFLGIAGLLWLAISAIPSREPSVNFAGHGAGVHSLAVSDDGSLIASASRDMTVKIWDPVTGQPRHSLDTLATCIAADPDGSRLFLATKNKIDAIDSASGEVSATFDMRMPENFSSWPIQCLSVSPDGKWLAAGATGRYDEGIAIWDLSADPPAIAHASRSPAACLAFSPDSKMLAVGMEQSQGRDGASSGTLKLFAIDGLKEIESFKAKSAEDAKYAHPWGRTASLAFSPDGKQLASGSTDTIALIAGVKGLVKNRGDVAVWEVPSGRLLGTIEPAMKHCNAVSYSTDGTSLYVAGGNPYPLSLDGVVHRFDAVTFKRKRTPVAINFSVEAMVKVPQQDRFVWAAASDAVGRSSTDDLKMKLQLSSL